MRILIAIITIFALVGPVAGASVPTIPPTSAAPPAAVDAKTLMCDRGKLLYQDDFASSAAVLKNWPVGIGEWTASDGFVAALGRAEDHHHPIRLHDMPMTNVVVQVAVRFDGADGISLSLDNQSSHRLFLHLHLDRAMLTLSSMGMNKDVDGMKLKLDPLRWHNVLWEVCGSDTLVSLDEQWIGYGQLAGIELPKARIDLMSMGEGKRGDFAHLRIWEANFKPDWEKVKKAKVLDYLKTRH